MRKGINRRFKDRYPELAKTCSIDKEHAGSTYITTTTRAPDESGFRVTERYIFKISLQESTDEMVSTQEMVQAATKLRNLALECGRKNIRVLIPDNQVTENIRKVLEAVFWSTELDVTLHFPTRKGGHEEEEAKSKETRRTVRTSRNTEAIIIKTGEKTYSQTLKEVKERLDLSQIGVEVKKVKKTQAGELLMTFRGGSGKTETLKQSIMESIKDARVRSLGQPGLTFQVYGVDAVTTTQEIRETISKTIAEEIDKVVVKAVRATTNDEQVATVWVEKQVAQKLRAVKALKIGWNYCRVREWLNVPRCHKCQTYGHLAGACDGPDRTSCCWNCGREGHRAAECDKEKSCIACKKEGHKTGSGQCPIFRKLLEDTKANRNKM